MVQVATCADTCRAKRQLQFETELDFEVEFKAHLAASDPGWAGYWQRGATLSNEDVRAEVHITGRAVGGSVLWTRPLSGCAGISRNRWPCGACCTGTQMAARCSNVVRVGTCSAWMLALEISQEVWCCSETILAGRVVIKPLIIS